jgi:hypothetical protein
MRSAPMLDRLNNEDKENIDIARLPLSNVVDSHYG